MDSRAVRSEIALLKFYQIFHLVLLILIIICHFISANKYIFIFKSLLIIFYLAMSIYFISSIFLFFSTIIIFKKKTIPSLFNLFKKISFILIILSIIKGFALTLIFWINYYNYQNFLKDCPFSFSIYDIEKLMKNTKNEKYSKTCDLKRCIFYSKSNENNLVQYNYICNFNSEYENNDYNYNKNGNNELDCHFMNFRDFSGTELYQYLEKCDEFDNYYFCSSNIKKNDKYFIKYNQKCPTTIQKNKFIILGTLFPLIDIIADLIIWLFIYFQYKRILKCINFETMATSRRLSPSSLNSTKDSSIIKPDNDNKDIITQINFNQTEIIIYPPLNSPLKRDPINIVNININNKNKNKKDGKKSNFLILEQNNTNIILNSRCDFINTRNYVNSQENQDYDK